jgi:hypothetical protein
MMWREFISILRAGNGLTVGLFVYCTVHWWAVVRENEN